MHRLLLLVASLVVLGPALASEVFVSRDAQGRPIYTDRPDSLPAQKVHVATQRPDAIVAPPSYDDKTKSFAEAEKAKADTAKKAADAQQAQALSAADKEKRCEESRAHYQTVMNARRLYEPGSSPDERRYLNSDETDAAREDAKKVMDEFCTGR